MANEIPKQSVDVWPLPKFSFRVKWDTNVMLFQEVSGLDGNRPVSPVLTGQYELCGKPYCGLDCSDVPGQKLVDAIDWMLGDAL